MKKLKFFGYTSLALLFVCATSSGFGQDLGSSNKLFDPSTPKTKPAKPLAKKSAAKPKSSAPAKVAKKSPTTVVKKSEVKPKTGASKNSTRNIAAETKPKNSTKSIAAETKPKNSVKKAADKPIAAPNKSAKQPPQKNVVITVGQPAAKPAVKPAVKPETAKTEFNELFEESIEAGNIARDEREYTKAEAAYLRAQSLKLKDARAIYGLGNLYSDQQRWEEAERAYRTAIEFEPNVPESYIALSFVLTQPIAGVELGDRYAEAERLARQAIKLDPKNAVGYDQLGVALELQGKISDETQNAYKKAIQIDPNFALAFAHLGRLLRRKGLTNESSASYRNAVQLSTDVPTMILVADVMQSQQRYVESEQLLRQALRDDPKNPTALYLLGRALTIRGGYDEAEKVLKKSAGISPNSFVSYLLLSSLYLRREQFDNAEKYLMKALSMVSSSEKKRLAQDFEVVGDGYLKGGKNKDAARAYRQAITLDMGKAILADKLAKAQRN